MTELLTAAQMRAIEQAAIESGEVTGLELMERAGRGVFEAIFEEWPELARTSHRAVVLCGPGNNGGDGFVVARLLKEWGWEVEVFLYGDPQRLPADAKVNYERWRDLGDVCALKSEENPVGIPVGLEGTKLVIDGVFGTGITRPVSGQLMSLFHSCNADGDLVPWRPDFPNFVSIDVPSGVCADSGRVMGAIMPSDLIVTFHSEKLGHHLGASPHFSSALRVKDIGLQRKPNRSVEPIRLVEGRQTRFCTNAYIEGNWLAKDETSESHMDWPKGLNKFDHGHALILSGGSGKTGAARLAARGALRIGAGLVTLGVPGSAQMEVASQITSLMLARVEDGDGLAAVLEDERLGALCLGPGLGVERARRLVPVAVRSGASHRAVVLDADALTAFEEAPEELFDMLHDSCVLTPHAGEFARLFPDIAEKLNSPATKGPAYSKVDGTREAAMRAGCVVLFKGPNTVIAQPDGRCSINSAQYERAAPWLATAGSGDVLAGFITGLLARGFDPMRAAETAAWLHVECARSFGPGLIAEDLPEELPKVFRDLGI